MTCLLRNLFSPHLLNFKIEKIRKLVVWGLLLNVWVAQSQDTALVEIFRKNKHEFRYGDSHHFLGKGWDSLVKRAGSAKVTAVGEVHGLDDVPILLEELAEQVHYDTFIVEIDPFIASLITEKIKSLSPDELKEWRKSNAGILSFYSYLNDFQLLQNFVENDVEIVGIDQITALNDIPIYVSLAESTTDPEKKEIFLTMARNAELIFKELLKNTQKVRPYLMTNQFKADLEMLEKTTLSPQESEIIQKLRMSRDIYLSRRGHEKRIMLMKNQLMQEYNSSFVDKKVLLRLGANHSLRGESFLDVYDVGNLVHNLAESEFKKSFHVGVFSKAGAAGNPLFGHPDTPVELPKDLTFLNDLTGEDWIFFDLEEVRGDLRRQKGGTNMPSFLKRIIEGYDGLVIMPSSIPAKME